MAELCTNKVCLQKVLDNKIKLHSKRKKSMSWDFIILTDVLTKLVPFSVL